MFENKERNWAACAFCAALTVLFLPAGCLSPEDAEKGADETAVKLATVYWQRQTGTTNTFDLTRPQDMLALHVALEAVRQGITNAVFPSVGGADPLSADSNGLVRVTLDDALRIGARNNRKFRTLKEAVYVKALAVDSEEWAFSTRFTGMIAGALAGEPELTKLTAEAGGDSALAKRKFEQGAVVAGNFAVDVAKMARDDWHSFGWTGDLAVSIPLLRGAGRDIVRESLTQAERDLDYALLDFERYRQTFALSVAKEFFGVLAYAQNNRNSADNVKRLQLNYDRAAMMFKAGRMTRIELDQAKTDLLSAQQSVITTQRSYRDALDSFKITLGLPPESPLALKESELEDLRAKMEREAAATTNALAAFPDETTAMAIAVSNRQDLAATRGALEDAERRVKVAADALRADLTLEGGVTYDGDRARGASVVENTTTRANVKFSLPWDRRRERNDYRRALITRDQARRTCEQETDGVKNEVLAGYRQVTAMRALYANKVEAYRTACMRVEANDLFTQSGRSSMRDILEAESALLSARNALCSAVIDWWTGELSLRVAMGGLDVNGEGGWLR